MSTEQTFPHASGNGVHFKNYVIKTTSVISSYKHSIVNVRSRLTFALFSVAYGDLKTNVLILNRNRAVTETCHGYFGYREEGSNTRN